MAGKKGKKKGKSGGGKRSKEPVMGYNQALYAYKITIAEQELEEALFENQSLIEQVSQHKEKLNHIKEDQEMLFLNLLREAHDFDKNLLNEEPVGKDAVDQALFDMWNDAKLQDNVLVELDKEIRDVVEKYETTKKEMEVWELYKTEGSKEHSQQISLLEHELSSMSATFEQMCSHQEGLLTRTKDQIVELRDKTLAQAKDTASEKAISALDQYDQQEVIDNDYLNLEENLHDKKYSDLLQQVEVLEQRNLDVMADLFEYKKEDLHFSRGLFLADPFEDKDNLDDEVIFETDLTQLEDTGELPKPRMKSAVFKELEKRFNEIVLRASTDDFDDLEVEEDVDDFKQIAQLENVMLNVRGRQAPVHLTDDVDEEPPSVEDEHEWPVTSTMLLQFS